MGKRPRRSLFRGNYFERDSDNLSDAYIYPSYSETKEDDTVLNSTREVIEEECPIIKKATVLMDISIWNKVRLLATKEDSEWLGILRGKRTKPDEIVITKLEIPEQERSYGACSAKEKINYPDLVGWIHSHHHMEAFMSSRDEETNGTTNISIVINSDLDMKGVMMVKAPCDHYFKVPIDIIVTTPETNKNELERWYKEVKKNFQDGDEGRFQRFQGFPYEGFGDEGDLSPRRRCFKDKHKRKDKFEDEDDTGGLTEHEKTERMKRELSRLEYI